MAKLPTFKALQTLDITVEMNNSLLGKYPEP